MRTFSLFALLLTFVSARSETITTIGGTTTTGNSSFLCLSNPFSQTSNVNSSSLTDYAKFSLVAGAGCSFYLHSTLNSIGAAGTEAGFNIQASNLTSLLSGITLDTYLDGAWQESASGSDLLSLLDGGRGDVYFKTTKAYDAIRIRFNSLVVLAYNVRIYWGYGNNTIVQTLPLSFKKFNLKEASGKVHLSWETVSNNEIESISIQKSSNNQNFNTLNTITAPALPFYVYEDRASVKAWYRLKITIKKNKLLYSPVLFYSPTEIATITLYPNPVKGNDIFIGIKSISSQAIPYVIIDATGRLVQKGTLNSELQLDVTHFKKGLHFFKTEQGESFQFLRQ